MLLGWVHSAAAQTHPGRQIYVNNACANCHADNGSGVSSKGPNLRDSAVWKGSGNRIQMIELLMFGKESMPGYFRVADNKMADMLDYIDDVLNQDTSRRKPDFTTAEVKGVRDRERPFTTPLLVQVSFNYHVLAVIK